VNVCAKYARLGDRLFLLCTGLCAAITMSVYIETSIGDVVVDLYTDECPLATKNFIKLCKCAQPLQLQYSVPVGTELLDFFCSIGFAKWKQNWCLSLSSWE
jgi:hypothetical protein